MGKQRFKFIGLSMAIYLGLFIVEIILKPLLDFIGNGFWTSFIVYGLLLLLINPIVTWLLLKLFKFESEDVIKQEHI